MHSELIQALQDPAIYEHEATDIQLIETHISWLLLTGPYAYKIKKPLDLGFLDFRDLQQRRFYCEEELRLNRRTAESIYQDVVTITGSPSAPALNGEGEPIEYALRMRQFDPQRTLDVLAERDELASHHMDELADLLAHFHQSAPPLASDSTLGSPEILHQPMRENLEQIREQLSDETDLSQLQHLGEWMESAFERLEPTLRRRFEQGALRECHGDLHLGNIALFEGQITIFDCIEFNEHFRWIDTANDLAFLLMDLEFRKMPAFADRVLNRYLELTGDFESLELLPLYKAYRAMIRAKIALLSPADNQEQAQHSLARYRAYAGLAEEYTAIPVPWLIITTGLSASGKSRVSAHLAEALSMVRIRSDVERKRLFGLAPTERSASALDAGIYTREATTQTYDRLVRLTRDILLAGYPVIVDSAALRIQEREALFQVAENLGIASLLVSCEAPEATLRERIRAREKRSGEASEAGEPVLDKQLASLEPLSESERSHTIHIRTDQEGALEALVENIRRHLKH